MPCAGGAESTCDSTAALEHGIVLALHAALQAGHAGLLFVMGLPSLAHEALSAEHPSPQVASDVSCLGSGEYQLWPCPRGAVDTARLTAGGLNAHVWGDWEKQVWHCQQGSAGRVPLTAGGVHSPSWSRVVGRRFRPCERRYSCLAHLTAGVFRLQVPA